MEAINEAKATVCQLWCWTWTVVLDSRPNSSPTNISASMTNDTITFISSMQIGLLVRICETRIWCFLDGLFALRKKKKEQLSPKCKIKLILKPWLGIKVIEFFSLIWSENFLQGSLSSSLKSYPICNMVVAWICLFNFSFFANEGIHIVFWPNRTNS